MDIPSSPECLDTRAGLLAIFGDVYEVPFHAAYCFVLADRGRSSCGHWHVGSLIGHSGQLCCSCRYLAFVINGNSLESDLPFLAFWMAGIAAFVAGRLWLAGSRLALAAMAAYQAVVATPILWAYCWFHARESKARWAVALTPVIVIALYQAFERATSGALPATVLAGYFSTYGLQQIANKLKNAAALTAHTGWDRVPCPCGVCIPFALVVGCRRCPGSLPHRSASDSSRYRSASD